MFWNSVVRPGSQINPNVNPSHVPSDNSFGMFSGPNNRLMMSAVPRERSGSAGGMIATARTLGQTMGAALVAVMFGLFDFSSGGSAAADAARAAIWLGAGFAAAALIIGSLRLRH